MGSSDVQKIRRKVEGNINMGNGTNVLLMLADDMNYNTIGCFGSPVENVSPNLDKLAEEGIRFENMSAFSSVYVDGAVSSS